VQPRIGRAFLAEEDRRGAPRVILISYELSKRLYGLENNAIGQSLRLDSQDYTIIGLVPPKFMFPMLGTRIDIWAPRVFDLSLVTPARVEAGGTYFHVIGRLRPGISGEQARRELADIHRQYRHDNPGKYDATIDIVMMTRDLREQLLADVRPTLLILSAAVVLLLLIACSNVASLEVARALGRRKEFAVRAALGAARCAVIRQVLTENLILTLISAWFGSILGLAGTQYLASLSQSRFPQIQNPQPDWRVAGFALALSMLSAMLISVMPAVEFSKFDVYTALREEGRGKTGSRGKRRGRGLLVVTQVALSTVLLVGAGLLIRSFLRLSSTITGFEPAHLLTLEMTLPPSKYAERSQLIGFYEAVLREVESLPSIQTAALSTALPAYPTHQTPARFEGQPVLPLGKRPIVNLQQFSPDYAKTLGIPLLEGRLFTEHDEAEAAPVAMVNRTAARRFWPGERAIGKRVWVGNLPHPFEITGVLADVKNSGLAEPPEAEVFLPLPQLPWTLLYLSARTSADPQAISASVRRAIAKVDREQPLTRVFTGEELLESANAQPRFTTLLISVFSAAAFVIAAVGIYGVIAYSVAQRTTELSLRIAIGAAKTDVFRLVIGDGLRLVAWGILLGLAVSFAATRVMASLLYETSARDPLIFAASAGLFTAVSLLASYLPARRAAIIDPVHALRAE
jgi:putative ABC transport system permease protein